MPELRGCRSCKITLRTDEKIGPQLGDPDGFFCSDPACPIMRAGLDALALREHLDAVARSRTNFATHEPLGFIYLANTPPSGPEPKS